MSKRNTTTKYVNAKPRLRLTDRQCRLFLKAMIEFGYKKLTFEEVRTIANELASGKYRPEDPICIVMARQIDEALTEAKKR